MSIGQCNECGKQSPMKSKRERLRNKIDKHYFQCIHCDQVYLIGYVDETIRRKRKRIRKLIDKNKETGLYNEQISSLKAEIESDMAELRMRLG